MLKNNFGLKEPKWILHIDADAFFASVEEALNPGLKNIPIAVGGNEVRGVVCSANYIARKFGIHSGMSTVKALKLCPHLKVIRSQFETYRYFSQRMFEILGNYSPDVERTSIDEGYIDLSGTEMMWGMPPNELAVAILHQIHQKLKISVSGGLSAGKLIAQIASKLFKPHRFVMIPHGYEEKFLWPLPLNVIPGVGGKTFQQLQNNGLNTVRDLMALSPYQISKKLDSYGLHIWQKIQRSVGKLPSNEKLHTEANQPKSISHEVTFRKDIKDMSEIRGELIPLINKVIFRLRKQKAQTSTVFLKMRSANFHTYTFHRKLRYPTDFDGDLIEEGQFLLRENFFAHRPLRLIGFGVEKLQTTYNLSIFQKDLEAKQRLVGHLDDLRKKYGFDVVSYGV